MLSTALTAPQHRPSRRPRLLSISPRYLFSADSGGKIRTVSVLRGMQGGACMCDLASGLPISVATDYSRTTLADVAGNDSVKRSVTFNSFITDRVHITRNLNSWPRITGIEAWGVEVR